MLCIAALTVAVVAMADGVEGDSAATAPYEEVVAYSEQEGEGQPAVVTAEPVQDQDVLAGEPVVGDVLSDQDAAPTQGQPAEDTDVSEGYQGEPGAPAADAAEGAPMSGQPEAQGPAQTVPDDTQAVDSEEAVLGETAQGYVNEVNALAAQVEGLDPGAEGFEAALEELGALIADLYDRWDASRAAGVLSESDDTAVSDAVASLTARLGAVAGVDLGQTYADDLGIMVSGATQASDGAWEIEVGSTMTATAAEDDRWYGYSWSLEDDSSDAVKLSSVSSRTVSIEAREAGEAKIQVTRSGWGVTSVGTITVRVVDIDPTQYNAVNFYVLKTAEVDRGDVDFSGPSDKNLWTNPIASATTNAVYVWDGANFIPSVYASYSDPEYLVIYTSDDKDVREADAEIRNLINGVEVMHKDSSKAYAYQLDAFPSDEQVLKSLRDEITGGAEILDSQNRPIQIADLTPDNYTIRWHVFKFRTDNGWHVDGVLLQKAGKVNITKTFVGDAEAIEAVKSGYSIAVEKSAGGGDADTRTLVLDASSGSGVAPTAEVTSEGGEITYTWTLEVDPGVEYVVRENKYDSPSDSIGVLAEYLVSNTVLSESGSATRDWCEYPVEGVTFTAQSYASDLPSSAYQTVALRNGYLPQNSLTLFKYDQANGAGLGSATFELYKAGSDTPTDLYKADGNYYLYEPAGQEFEKVTELAVNEGGYAVILGLDGAGRFAGSYELREKTAPEGYAAGGAITLEFAEDGTITKSDGLGTLKVVGEVGHAYQLDVPNSSLTVDITAKKVWGSDALDERKPVEVQLYNGDTPVSGAVYTLSEDNNWTVSLGTYPQYTGGFQANYRIVETKIGDTYRDPAADKADGFRDYTVSYDAPAYSEVEGKKVLTLTVRNSKLPASSVTVGKQVTGNMGDVGETFSFRAECFYMNDEAGRVYIEPSSPTVCDASGKVLSLDDIGYTPLKAEDGRVIAVSFNLKSGYSVTFPNVTNGNQFQVIETTEAAGYRTRVHLNGATTMDSDWPNTGSVYEGTIEVAAGSANSILFENNKEEQLGMGVSLTEGPFGLMVAGVLAAAAVGFVVFRMAQRGSCDGAHRAGRYR